MALSLSARIGGKGGRGGTINADGGSGFRSNTADFGMSAKPADRGSFGAEQDPNFSNGQPNMSSSLTSSLLPGNPHSSSGFRRALEKTKRSTSKLSGNITDKTNFGGKGFKKPNYFAQGAQRHGMHIGSGSPATIPAADTGSDIGGS